MQPEQTDEAAAFRKVQPEEFYRKFLAQGVRPDGRALLGARKATPTPGAVTSADGSCMLKLGKTVVLAGVQCEPGVPTKAGPALGRVVVSLEVSSVASVAAGSSARGAAGRLDRELAPLRELLQRTACDDLLDLDTLCIAEGRAVWKCHCDVYIIEHDGNLTDAAMLALTCAIADVRLPRVEFGSASPSQAAVGAAQPAEPGGAEGGGLVVREERAVPLRLARPVYPVSFGLLSSRLLLDPCAEEEALASCGFTVLLDGAGKLCALHKPGGAPLSPDQVEHAIVAAQQRLPALVALVALVAGGSEAGVGGGGGKRARQG